MIKKRSCISEVILAFMLLASIAPAYAQTKTHLGVHPSAMLALGAAVGVGDTTNLQVIGGGADFTVPSGKVFILTDIIISPQEFPPSGDYLIQVLPSAGSTFTTALSVTSSAANPSSFQVNLTGGMVFLAGSKVRVFLNAGSGTSVNVSAFGYLVKKQDSNYGTDND
jgi:hypothetical protein